MKEQCRNCRFGEFFPGNYNGICRRYPPKRGVRGSDGFVHNYWPEVDAYELCGEYEPREKEQGETDV